MITFPHLYKLYSMVLLQIYPMYIDNYNNYSFFNILAKKIKLYYSFILHFKPSFYTNIFIYYFIFFISACDIISFACSIMISVILSPPDIFAISSTLPLSSSLITLVKVLSFITFFSTL